MDKYNGLTKEEFEINVNRIAFTQTYMGIYKNNNSRELTIAATEVTALLNAIGCSLCGNWNKYRDGYLNPSKEWIKDNDFMTSKRCYETLVFVLGNISEDSPEFKAKNTKYTHEETALSIELMLSLTKSTLKFIEEHGQQAFIDVLEEK